MDRGITLCRAAIAAAVMITTCPAARAGTWRRDLEIRGTVAGVLGRGRINVFLPSAYAARKASPFRLLIVLHGWRGHGHDWERNSPLSHYADKHRYVVVAPHMGTTVYERSYYPETRGRYRWGAIPGGRWIGEVVLPHVRRRYNVSKAGHGTGIFGLSTGGRGAALLPAYYPGSFGAFAALSADYDITMDPREPTATHIYGLYARFPERWKRDNSRFLLDRMRKVPALLIHGGRDRVCQPEQSRLFAAELGRRGYDVTHIEDPNLGHDWKLWSGYLGAVFDFFDDKLRAR